MPESASEAPSKIRWSSLAAIFAGLVFSLGAVVWVPWQRVHPNDPALRETIGYAPLWSHRFDAIPGAGVDWTSFVINLVVIWVICGAAALMLRMSGDRD